MALPTYSFNSGIVSTANQGKATYLPLDKLDVHISIIDVSARVVLSQEYSHHGSDTLSEAYYVFPVPARAAVCGFEMKANNGVRLKGVVKELSQAKEDYQEALSNGLLAGLLEQYRQDVFVVSIGSMPPNTNVTVLLSYVVDLSEDDEIDSVRFQLSSHVRVRYGAPSNSVLSRDTIHNAPLSITVDINMPGDILEATSWNHIPFVDLPVLPSLRPPGTRPSRHFSRKRFSSSYFDLQRDFLLTVRAYGLGKPRCFAEQLSREENKLRSVVGPTTALALTIVPQFDLNMRLMQGYMEYIFVIDRSGSMAGNGIRMAKQTLQLLLKQLSSNSTFNIYSFGSRFYPMWHQSQQYTNANLHIATMEVQAMEADMGGTELLDVLKCVFGARRPTFPTSVFVLTDGQIWDIDSAVEAVSVAVSVASVAAPLRVFTLGVGSGASIELCQRLAWVGNGSCIMTVEGEPLAFKAMRLVRAMETPQVKEMSIDWGHGVIDQVRQAPHRIGALSPGMRLLVTAIIPIEHVPAEVALKLRLADGTTFNYQVPVELVSDHIPETLTNALGGTTDIPPLIHTLAAHLLIQDVEGGDAQPLELQKLTAPSPETTRNVIEKYIVELGTQYQVASSYTAFVAVAAPAPSSKPPGHHGSRNRPDSRSNSSRHQSSQGDSSALTSSNCSQGSSNGRSNGTHGHQSNTNGKSGARSRAGSGMSAQSSSSKPSKDSYTRGNTKKQGSSKASGKSDDESFMTPPSRGDGNSSKKQKSSPTTRKTSTRSSTSPASSHASQGKKGSASGSPSDSTETQSQSPRMPGGFKQPPDTETTGPGWLFDFFTHRPSPESVLPEEVLCVPDPRGGSPMIFTAPPPYYTTITTMARSWLNRLQSFIFTGALRDRSLRGGAIGNSQRTPLAFPRRHTSLFPEEILTIARLQSSDGSFPCISWELSSVVGIDEVTLRNSAPSMTYGEDNEAVWATAIAIAFCTKRLYEHVALWEGKAEKARDFGSKACGSEENFENIVQEALKLFLT